MRYVCFLVVAVVVVSCAVPARATMPFFTQFKKEYIDTLKDKKAAEAMGKSEFKCLICHQGKSKKNRNAFGSEMAKLLTKKDVKDTKKMDAAFKKVLAMPVNPKDKKSETYLDRLKAGKWPAGELAELKKEPAKNSKEAKEAEAAEKKE